MKFIVIIPLFILLQNTQAITNGPTNSYIHVPERMLPAPLPEKSLKISSNLTLNQCAAECSLEYHLKRFPCYAFEYTTTTKTCVLSNITTLMINGGYLGLRKSPVMQFFERSKGSYLSLFQPIRGMALQQQDSYFALFYNMTREKCAYFCLLETRQTCMSFSYSETKQVCGLSNLFYSKTNGQALTPSTIYDHYQYYSTWPCNATIPWNYSPRALASPYFPYASLKDVDCHVIIEAPEGKQVDLQFSTFFTQRNICNNGEQNGLTIIDGQAPTEQNVLKKLCKSDNFVDRRFMSSTGYLYLQFATGDIPMAFKAVYDFVTPDPCANSPCQNGGVCSARGSSFSCACVPGYTGSMCETDIDDCASAPCLFGGQCIDRNNSFECICPRMLGGSRCDLYIGLCSERPCKNDATCSPRGQDDYVCDCKQGYTGKNCSEQVLPDPCSLGPCQNNGTCQSAKSTGIYSCTCIDGFKGDNCEINIDDCANSPCFFNVPCVDLVNDYRCQCPAILSGKRCETFIGKCSENPCVNGRCSPVARDNYTCSCFDGFSGQNCTDKTFNFCKPNPCKHGSCKSYDNGPSCTCDFDYEGVMCDRRIDHCRGIDCNQGECKSLEGRFKCKCIEGYTGRFCNETIDHCIHNNCGTGQCINTISDYFCLCKDGKTGKTCQTNILSPNCSSSTCIYGTCQMNNGSSACICREGYRGSDCGKKIDYCTENPCSHGSCINQLTGYSCSCDPGYSGTNCSNVKDHCKDAGCVYGLCQNTINGFTCICGLGYHGNLCQYSAMEQSATTPAISQATTFYDIVSNISATKGLISYIQYCSKETCVNGTCIGNFPGHCNCSEGFTGQRCDIFMGCDIFNPCNHGVCTQTNNSYRCTCDSHYTGPECDTVLPAKPLCNSSPCENNGMCWLDGDSYTCICVLGFTGQHCQYVDRCQHNPCKTGKCIQTDDNARCEMVPLIGNSSMTSLGLPFLSGADYGVKG